MFKKTTEDESPYRHLERMSTLELLTSINDEDRKVPEIVRESLQQIAALADCIKNRLLNGGRLFYIGAGTSGRLGVLDASECPPTYGVSDDLVVGIMAGGDEALRFGLEEVEDFEEAGWDELEKYNITNKDCIVGIAASGTTPYVIGALKHAKENGIATGCIVCNRGTPVAALAGYPIEIVVGPEVVTGSTRMKAGTAQKLVLNMISTSVMIGIGLVEDNRMINMKISNQKLVERGVQMILEKSAIDDYDLAKKMLLKYGSVKLALLKLNDKAE